MAALKELALNPIALASILAILLVYSLLIFEAISNKSILIKLDRSLTTLVFIGAIPVSILPFSLALPQRLCVPNLSFTGALTTLVIWIPIVFFLKRISFPRLPKDLLAISKDPFLTILIFMAISSSLWSQTPDITLRSAASLVVIAILATHISKKYTWDSIESFMRISLTSVAFISLVIILIFPSIQPYGEGGLVKDGRTLGNLMALNVGLWFAHMIYRREWFGKQILIVLVSLFLIVLFAGKTSLITALALAYLVLALKILQFIKFKQSIIFVMISILLISCLAYLVNSGLDMILQILGKDATFTGRTEFWPHLLEEVSKHPIGFGYNGFWQPWRGTEDPAALIGSGSLVIGNYRPPHSHNGFLEIALQLGSVGLLLYGISFIRTLLLAIWHQQFFKGSEGILPLLILTFLIVSNLTETEYLGLIGPNHTLFFYILLTSKLSLKNRSLGGKNLSLEFIGHPNIRTSTQ